MIIITFVLKSLTGLKFLIESLATNMLHIKDSITDDESTSMYSLSELDDIEQLKKKLPTINIDKINAHNV